MRFDESYPEWVKHHCVQRQCENPGCPNMTFWRYDLSRGDAGRIFFAVCSSECLRAILDPMNRTLQAIHEAANLEPPRLL